MFILNLNITKIYSHEELNPDIEMIFLLSSTYIDRGEDIFENQFRQSKTSIGSFNYAPVLQSNITFHFFDSWSFHLGTSHALTKRNDKDLDKLFQLAPYDSSSNTANVYLNFLKDQVFIHSTATPIEQMLNQSEIFENSLRDGQHIPSFYKEPVGLKHFDQFDFILKYSYGFKHGMISLGILNSILPNFNIQNKVVNSSTEFFVEYIPDFLSDLMISFYKEIQGENAGNNFIYINYSFSLLNTNSFQINFNPGIAYQIQDYVYGIKYIDFPFIFL